MGKDSGEKEQKEEEQMEDIGDYGAFLEVFGNAPDEDV
jgi:hypothetical protein